MIEIGCLARFNNPYNNEVKLAVENDFKIMQVWYDRDGIRNHQTEESRLQEILKHKFPTIIHAVLDINEIEEHMLKLISILKILNQKELIVHPVCHSEKIDEMTIYKLVEKIGKANELLNSENIILYLENNSKLDPIFSTTKEIEIMFTNVSKLEFLVDIAHIYSYEHLKEMISIKKPKILHITDKHFAVIHEHLPIGDGELNFQYIFNEILSDFQGKIIFEITNSDQDIINGKKIIEKIINKK